MDEYSIWIAYVAWNDGGKLRPILIISENNDFVYAFSITTKYDNKSDIIKSQYFLINDWKISGLNEKSYIDTGDILDLQKSDIKSKKPIGELTNSDKN
ncbi:hypothetical protein FACS1894132_13980 [Clostridia bacterium]|nr:hypothetical protein FACS1894132_13980 [Clostridia bacterium]